MRHPAETELALYSSSDLSLWRRWILRGHLGRCPDCRRELEAFRSAAQTLAHSAPAIPPGLHWGKLAAEMKANIRLGLEAGRIAGGAEDASAAIGPFAGWRPAAALATVTMLMFGGWWLQRPAPSPRQAAHADQGVVLKATDSGIELNQNGRALALVHRDSQPVMLTVGAQGSLRARYLDEDTGEVTIHHVYVE